MKWLTGFVIAISAINVDAVQTILAGDAEDCIIVRANPGAEVLLNYEALPDEEAKVACRVEKISVGPDGRALAQGPNHHISRIADIKPQPSGKLNLTASVAPEHETHFAVCFTNAQSNQAIELVFAIRADVFEHLHDVATKEHTANLHRAVYALEQETKELLDQQEFTVARERGHRAILAHTHQRIFKWTLIQAVFLAGLAAAQVIYIRRLFQGPKTIL